MKPYATYLFLAGLSLLAGCGTVLMVATLLEMQRMVLTSAWFYGVAVFAFGTMLASHRFISNRESSRIELIRHDE